MNRAVTNRWQRLAEAGIDRARKKVAEKNKARQEKGMNPQITEVVHIIMANTPLPTIKTNEQKIEDGMACYQKGDGDKAMEWLIPVWEREQSRSSLNIEHLQVLATLLLQKDGKEREAEQVLKCIIERVEAEPGSEELTGVLEKIVVLGETYIAAENLDKAEDLFKFAAE
ncbi:hypothetical protein DID78_07105, partial [Candidatus Marinamargulisbacteria bacterium SCGC AG-343-D04]